MLLRVCALTALVCSFASAQTINLTASSTAVPFGQPIVLTASVAGTGLVVFTDNGRWLGTASLVGGQAALVTKLSAPGTHSIRAIFNSASAAVSVNVNGATPRSFRPQTAETVPEFWHDLNGDGLLDKLVIGGLPFRVSAQLNVGNGTFGPIGQAQITAPFTHWAVADLDSDGRLDLLYWDSDGRFKLLRGKGNALFEAPEVLQIDLPFNSFAFTFQAHDMNGDGRADLVLRLHGEIAVWLQASPKAFVKHSSVAVTPEVSYAFLLGDLNGDGRPDIMTVANPSATCLTVVSSGQGWIQGSDVDNCVVNILADFNNDGRADLVSDNIGGPGRNYISVRLAQQNGAFGPVEPANRIQSAHLDDYLVPNFAVDWNKDGNLDLVTERIPSQGSTTLGIHLGNGDGSFRPVESEMRVVRYPQFSSRYQLADLNGDALPDLVSASGSLIADPERAPVIGNMVSGPGRIQIGERREFAFNGVDQNDGTDIVKAYLLIGSDTSGANACYVEIDALANTVRLRDDAGANWSAPTVIGSYNEISNSKCQLQAPPVLTTISSWGASFRVAIMLNFTEAFMGDREVFARVIDRAGNDTGFKLISGVFVSPPPKPFPPFMPSQSTASVVGTGSGPRTNFQLTITDPDGRYDVGSFTFSLSSRSDDKYGCHISMEPLKGSWGLKIDTGVYTSNPDAATGVMSNSQCSVDTSAASYTYSGKSLILTIPVTFKGSFAGRHTMYLTFPGSPFQPAIHLGSWVVKFEPFVRSLLPTSGAGPSATFVGEFFTDPDAPELYLAYTLFLPTPNVVQFTAKGSCLVEYNRISHGVRLIDDLGTGWLGPQSGLTITPIAAVLSNKVCSVNVAGVSVNKTGSTRTVSIPVTFKSGTQGVLGTFLQAFDVLGNYSGMTQFGNWIAYPRSTPAIGPSIDRMSQTHTSGRNTVVSVEARHSAGLASLTMVHLFAGAAISDPAPCQVVYFPGANAVNLINDDGTALVAPTNVAIGSPTILSNHRCSVDVGAATRSTVGNGVALNVPVSFTGSFLGQKNLYAVAFDVTGLVTHWVQGGVFTVQ